MTPFWQMFRPRVQSLLHIAFMWMLVGGGGLQAATIIFSGMTNDIAGYNEPDVPIKLNEAAGLGLHLSVLQGISFNVGCGGACLGADLATLNDFDGDVEGLFDLQPYYLQVQVGGVGATTTTLFDTNNNVIGVFANSFTYSGAGGAVGRFETDFDVSAFTSITFLTVPEPDTFGLLTGGLLVLSAVKLRRKHS